MTADEELRMICLEKALRHFDGQMVEQIVEVAQRFYDFITRTNVPVVAEPVVAAEEYLDFSYDPTRAHHGPPSCSPHD
jgi:hypothetical protein